MKQEIRFKGMSLDRDELATQHGELAFCAGVDLHNGSLRPSILDGTEEVTLKIGDDVLELLYVHTGPGGTYKHYIAKIIEKDELQNDVLCLYYFNVSDNETEWAEMHAFRGDDVIKDIKANGNVLTVIDSDGIQYFLWKDEGEEEGYEYLGQIPEIDIQFGLSAKTAILGTTDIDLDLDDLQGNYDLEATSPITINEADVEIVTEKVLAEVNKAVNKNYNNGYFSFPFFVRYALRLYDGSLTRHSAPILMMPTGGVCTYTPSTYNGSKFEFASTGLYKVLTYYIQDSSQFNNLLSWSDIIKSVDVFISAPIYSYNQAGQCKRFLPINYYEQNENYKAIGFYRYNSAVPVVTSPYNKFSELPYSHNGDYKLFVELPQFEDDNQPKVENVSNFFLFRSISLKDLKSQQDVEFEPEQGELTSITAKLQMTDDYDSHDSLNPASSYVYNARLNIFNILKDKFIGFHPVTCFNMTTDPTKMYIMDCYVHVRSDIGTTVVHNYKQSYLFSDGCMPRWFYYPDPTAFKAVWLVRAISGYNPGDAAYKNVDIYELDLKEHTMLNGSYWFDDYKEPTKLGTYVDNTVYPNYPTDLTEICPLDDLENPNTQLLPDNQPLPDSCKPLAEVNRTVSMPNSIYTSKANNPFFFPNLVDEAGVNTVGSGTILGMATVTRALSTGQVGDQDLIVFASDGIWVMKVSSTGTYTNLNNISREVCTGQENICQLDQSVIFATNRSINRFVESDSVPISDVLDGPNVPFTTIMSEFCGHFAQDSDITNMLTFAQNMNISMLANCKVIYDYSMLRLLVLEKNQQGTFTRNALVFCMRDQSWSLMVTPKIKAFIPGYPYPFYQDNEGKVFVLDKPYHKITTPSTFDGAIITRTLAFSETMDVIQGYQQLCNLATKPLIYVYGSNDQNTWKLIGYSNREFTNYLPGHPFRYFRVAMAITMTTEERYQSIVLDVINKYAKL